MADLIYASIFWALLAWAGHFFIGPIEGIALWRIFAITGISGFIHGYLTRVSRGVAGRLKLNRELEELTAIARGEEPLADEHLTEVIAGRHTEALRKFWSYPCSFGFEYHGTMGEDEMRAVLGMPEHFDLYDTIGAAGWEADLEELETCIIGGCDRPATVGVTWAGEKEIIFRFCAGHDPRRTESSS